MITAIALCAHLASIGAVSHCKAKSADAADFELLEPVTGERRAGAVMVFATDESFTKHVEPVKAMPQVALNEDLRLFVMVGTKAPIAQDIRDWTVMLGATCDNLAAIQATKQAIAHEKANPAGVVNLTYLHQLGEQLQSQTEVLATSLAAYRAFVHKDFDKVVCQ